MPAPLRPEDIYRFRWIDHVRLSRDGERIAYQLGWADAESRHNRSRVVVRRLLDPEPVEATAGARRDHSPEWSPDGRRLAFVSKRGAVDQIFVLDPSGGEAVQVSALAEGASSPVWSPDGSHLAFIGTVLSDPAAVVDDPRPPESSEAVRRTPVARIASTLDYKHDGQGYVDGRHHHAFVVAAGGGEATQLTNGVWDVTGFDWSPDGTRLVVIGDADTGADLKLETHIYSVDFTGALEKIATGFDLGSPAWSPRGDLIAYIGQERAEGGLLERLWIVPATGGQPRCVTANLDQAVGDSMVTDMHSGHGVRIRWSGDGTRIYFPASGPGVTGLYSVDLDGNVRAEVGGERRIFDFDVAGNVIAFCASDTNDPGELHVVMQGAEARLTDLNPWLRDRYVAVPEEQSFTASDGWVLQGWLMKPAGFDPTRLYPLVMEVHGGPHAEYGWAFFHEMQILAGMGYLVFYINPRGSDGYGEVFRKAVVRDWGGKDYLDLMTALDQLIERTGFVDTSRMGIGGGSYGGFMTNWIIGQTGRFSAAVAMRSISNLVSEYAQHDIVLWGELELGPMPWPDPEELWNRSPIRNVKNVTTPLLLTCGEMDLRCAISQSEEMFGALRLQGKTVELVRFPEESHDLSRSGRPDRREERLRRIAGWYERFLGTATAEKSAARQPAATDESVEEVDGAESAESYAGVATAEAEAPQAVEAEVAEAEPMVEPEAPVDEVAPAPVDEAPAEFAADATPLTTDEVAPDGEPAADESVAETQAMAVIEALGETADMNEAGPAVEAPVSEQVEAATEEPAPTTDVAETHPPQPAPSMGVAETGPPQPAAVEEPEAAPIADVAATVPPEPTTQPAPEAAQEEAATQTIRALRPDVEHAPEPAPAGEQPAASEPGPSWDQAAPQAPAPQPTWDEAPAPAPAAATWDEAPASTPPPEPQPVAAASAAPAATPPPVSENPIASTVIAWPAATPAGDGVRSGEPGAEEVATSIMPAWGQPGATAPIKETLALHALTPEQAATEPAAKLTFETGPFAGRVVGIPDQSAMVGRAPDNDIIIGDPATSGRHCRIEVRGGVYWISDLGSTNGTLVNGEPIIDKQLDHGDVISVGQNTIRFTLRS